MKNGKMRHAPSPKPIAHPASPPGLIVKSDAWGFEYKGAAESLVAAGLALPEWLPGQPGCPNVVNFAITIDGRSVEFRRNASGTYVAIYRLTKAEKEAMCEPEDRQATTGAALLHRGLATMNNVDTPALLRYQNALVQQVGIRVTQFDDGTWEWIGDRDQFIATGLFRPTQNWAPKSRNRLWVVGLAGIRAHLTSCKEGLSLVHEHIHEDLTWKGRRTLLTHATADVKYQCFREQLLASVPLLDE